LTDAVCAPRRGTTMDPLCLLVAGVVRATMPASEFTVDWMHSGAEDPWEERYRTDGDGLLLIEPRCKAAARHGAAAGGPDSSCA